MSNVDYQSGMSFGAARARAVSQDAQSAIADWESYANGLRNKLGAASESGIFTEAKLEAQTALLRRLEAELRRLSPGHELLNEGTQRQIKTKAMAETLEKHGYRYDTTNFTVSKIR
jgi:hypothetical protein